MDIESLNENLSLELTDVLGNQDVTSNHLDGLSSGLIEQLPGIEGDPGLLHDSGGLASITDHLGTGELTAIVEKFDMASAAEQIGLSPELSDLLERTLATEGTAGASLDRVSELFHGLFVNER